MRQCCMKRDDTGQRCTNLIPDEDQACDDCCDALEVHLEVCYLEALYAGKLPGLERGNG